jgi:glycosyltransferase involved in cell wall biosynthesis
MNITLFVPVLNEREGLETYLPKIPQDLFCQILVVDGNSIDGSAEWAVAQGYEVYVQKKPGLHHAYREAWSLIRGDYVVTFSPDGNAKVEDLRALINKACEGYDMVIASRYKDGAKSEDDGLVTGYGNKIFTGLINIIHGGNYIDAMTIYRIYRTKLYYELCLDDELAYRPERWFFTKIGIEPLLSVRAAKRRCKIAEIPSDEPKRTTGKRKLQIVRWGLSFLAQIIIERFN